MIRLSKPVQILQWGLGTNTTNQRWEEIAKGRLAGKPKTVAGLTSIVIEVEGSINRKNDENDFVKVMQQGEGMTPHSAAWGEVAMGSIKSVDNQSGKTLVTVETSAATKYGK